jgi:probable blue pigment (indigoidine) exporter
MTRPGIGRAADLVLTGLAPAVWGTTYVVTTELLPAGRPLTDSLLRALPAGLVLLLFAREWPRGIWLLRVLVLGALNFSLFWWLMFVSAYRLPGGVAAVLISTQPLLVLGLAAALLGAPLRSAAIGAGLAGVLGVGLLVLRPGVALDPLGIAAGIAGALSMALGTVLAKRWQPEVSALTFTAWQLVAGGLLLLPPALIAEPMLRAPTLLNLAGYLWLGLFGGALSYILWFRGVARIGPAAASPLVLLSPVTAVILGWLVAGQTLTALQSAGIALVLASVVMSQRVQGGPPGRSAAAEAGPLPATERPSRSH